MRSFKWQFRQHP